MSHAELEILINGLGTGEKNTALEVRTILFALLQGIHQPGDIKPVYCTAEDIANDYDATGLGIGKRAGWAICNGLNDTPPIGGRTIIGVGDAYSIGVMGGEKTHVLTLDEMPQHEHLNGISDDIKNAFVYGGTTLEMPGSATTDIDTGGSSKTYQGKTSKAGNNKEHNNMQPFIALLYIQKKA
ncbi:hypothetical protein [Flavobacterium sp.]|uniref:hypothetical protein n=1 Tax=Flavobacterium sp. TaxID=239 RepID=UPI002B7C5FB9|nr:hypothetical protein [Flavobacterium sp.]HSD07891.1 hypothetical protein [Flavobacterium sp.]